MIIWSEEASQDYWANIEFLLDRWSEKEAEHFIATSNEYLSIIEKHPLAFKQVGYKNVRGAVIFPQITLFYRVLRNSDIELVRFWNNYQDPKKLKI